MLFRKGKRGSSLWNRSSKSKDGSSAKISGDGASSRKSPVETLIQEVEDYVYEEESIDGQAILKTASTSSTYKPYIPLNQRLEMQGVQLDSKNEGIKTSSHPGAAAALSSNKKDPINLLPELDKLCLPIKTDIEKNVTFATTMMIKKHQPFPSIGVSASEEDEEEARDEIGEAMTKESSFKGREGYSYDEFSIFTEGEDDFTLNTNVDSHTGEMMMVMGTVATSTKKSVASSLLHLLTACSDNNNKVGTRAASIAANDKSRDEFAVAHDEIDEEALRAQEKAEMRLIAQLDEQLWRENRVNTPLPIDQSKVKHSRK